LGEVLALSGCPKEGVGAEIEDFAGGEVVRVGTGGGAVEEDLVGDGRTINAKRRDANITTEVTSSNGLTELFRAGADDASTVCEVTASAKSNEEPGVDARNFGNDVYILSESEYLRDLMDIFKGTVVVDDVVAEGDGSISIKNDGTTSWNLPVWVGCDVHIAATDIDRSKPIAVWRV